MSSLRVVRVSLLRYHPNSAFVNSARMSSYDEYYETDDPWERHQQRMELDAHLARCREQEAKRHASMARAGELAQHESVADALLPALVRHLATLRALACTCRAWRAKVREHFASLAQLQLYRHDVSEGNAAFVYGPLLERRPDLRVTFVHEDDNGTVRGWTIPRGGLKTWMDNLRRRGKWVLDKEDSGDFATFFESRAVAKIPELRLVLPWESGATSRKRPISFTCEELSTLKFAPTRSDQLAGKFKLVQSKLARTAFEIIAGCHLVAALEALTGPAWLQNADLDLSFLHLDDEGARTVALKMRKNAPPKSICLAHTMSRDGSLGMLGVLGSRDLSTKDKARVDVSCLQSLSIQGGRLWESVPLRALDSTLRSLGQDSKLTKLDLRNSRMGAQGMRTLSKHLNAYSALHLLEELVLVKNNLGNEGLLFFQDAGLTMPKLRYLDIGHNYIDARYEVRFVQWIGDRAHWPCIKRVHLFYESAPLFKLLEKTCALARARCEWAESLNYQANCLEDPEASDFDVPQGHPASESSSSDASSFSEEEEQEEEPNSSDEEEEEDHDE